MFVFFLSPGQSRASFLQRKESKIGPRDERSQTWGKIFVFVGAQKHFWLWLSLGRYMFL